MTTTSATAATPQPMTAAAFAATLGVNAHLSQGTVNYGNSADVIADLRYLGIWNVRDSYNPYWLTNYTAIASAGAKFDFLAAVGGSTTAASVQSFLSGINNVSAAVPGSVLAVEGPNEINNWPITYNGVGGLQGAIDYQQALYSQAHADTNLPGVKVYYFTGWDVVSGGKGVNPATTAGLADYDNQHPYPGNGTPPLTDVNRANALANETPATGPAVYTETGYSNTGTFGGNLGLTGQAKYTLDLLMDDAQIGIAHAYLYELMEEGDGLGLFDKNNNPTPAATAIHNLTSILADSGTVPASATGASFSVSNLPSSGHDLSLIKSNGATDIIVWAEPQITATTSGPATSVTVSLGATYATVKVFDPLLGSAAVQTLSNVSSVNLSVTDHPLIVETEPGSTVTPPPPPPPPADILTLRMSEDAYLGDAQFVVRVGGTQVGGTLTASALHATGDSNVFTLTGAWGQTTSHDVQIQFLNDAYGGTATTDRNLYVNSIAYDGTTYTGTTAALMSAGSQDFTVGGSTATTPAPADTLTVHLSEDAYLGNAQFTLSVDGKLVSTPQDVATLHSSGQWEDFTFAGNFGAGTHTVGVAFTNDAYGGTPTTDRNLYVNGVDVNGQHYGSGVTTMLAAGTTNFAVVTTH